MANWTDFLAKFSGSYLTIATELRDDSAITDVDQFHQLRSLVESGLSDKLAALTSTGSGFLHEWATFLDTEKGDVASGSQADEPAYSNGKWTSFKAEFLSEYGDTIDGLRTDLKHSDFTGWSEFIGTYTSDYQALITDFSTDGAFGFNTINDFFPLTTNDLKSIMDGLNSASPFIDEFATLLNTKKAGLDGSSTWTDFRNNFDTEWQQTITNLELDLTGMTWATFYAKTVADHKTDLVNSGDQAFLALAQLLINHKDDDWERFNALTLTTLRNKLADLDTDSEFFAGYTQVLADQMDDLVNLYDKMIPEFEEGERTVIADLMEYLQTDASPSIADFDAFLALDEASKSKHLEAFLDHASGDDFADHYATTIKAAADAAFAPCVNEEENIQKFYEGLTSGMLQNFTSFFDTMLANGTVSSYEDLSTATDIKNSIKADLKLLPCGHPFIHSQAKFVDQVAQGMIPRYTYSYALHVKLMDTATEPQPFVDMTVELQDTTSSEVLSQDTTADDGRVFLRYEILHEKQNLPATQTFDVVVKDSDDSVFHTESDVTATVDSLTATTISIARPAIPEPDSSDITDIFIDHPTVTLPSALDTFLSDNNISTLFNIREIGGLENDKFEGADPVVDDTQADVIAAIELIDQHAGLDALNPEQIVLNQNLIDDGYTSVNQIASTPTVTFKSDTSTYLTDEEAQEMHDQARALQNVNNNIIASLIVGDQYQEPANFGGSGNIWNENWEEIKRKLDVKYQAQCTVNENESAVSPLAYLYDLIEYITTSIKDDTTNIDIAYLEGNLHQRFSDLVGSADQVDTTLSNMRVMVEILRRYLVDETISVAVSDIKGYLERAYVFLLSQLNIGYSELSKAAKADAKTQEEFADEYNIEVSTISDIYFDIKADPTTLSEESLGEYFGLVDSTQPPLSTGTKITSTDSNDSLVEWSFNGISHELNTNADGYLFANIARTGSSPNYTYTLELYTSAGNASTSKVGEGSVTTNQFSGITYLKPVNDSGLTGYIKFNYTADDSDIKISVIPKFIASRLNVAKAAWKEVDDQVVLIDPDIVNPDDFINPYNLTSGAGKLWNDRKIDLEGQYTTISGLPSTNDDTDVHGQPTGTLSIESVALIGDSIYTVDSAGKIGVIYNGTDGTFLTSGGTGVINTKDEKVYLPGGSDATIKQYTTSGTYNETEGTVTTFNYVDKDSTNYKFQDMTWKTNGNLIIGAIDDVANKDILIETTPATASKYNGGHITWDAAGNAYVLNAAEPSLLKISPTGEILTSYGYKVDNPARHYKLENTTMYEEIGAASSGSVSGASGSVTAITGKFDDGVLTDGLTGFLKPSDIGSSDTGAFSISLWVKPHNVDGDHAQMLLSLSHEVPLTNGLRDMGLSVYLEKGNLYTTHWYYDNTAEAYTRKPIALEIKSPLTTGAWHHIALSVEGSTTETEKANGIKLYIDGNLSGTLPATLFDEALEVYMGGLDTDVQVKSHHFDPDVQDYVLHTQENGCRAVFDEVKIFHRVITPSDVKALYDDTTTGILAGPKDFVLSPSGEVYLLDTADEKVKVFSNDGTYLSEMVFDNTQSSDDFVSIALDSNGNIYVGDFVGNTSGSGAGQIRIFDKDGVAQTTLTQYGNDPSYTNFHQVYAVYVDAYDRLFVAQYDPGTSNPLSKVLVYDVSTGTPDFKQEITEAESGIPIKKPSAICSDAAGNIYVTNSDGKWIVQYDKSLSFVKKWGGTENFMFDALGSNFENWGSISISPDNEIFFGKGTQLTGDYTLFQTRMPEKVVVDNGGSLRSMVSNRRDEVFISRGSEITRYNSKERTFTKICDTGNSEGEVDTPKQLAIDGFDRIYVADYGNDRLQMIDREGNFLRDLDSFAPIGYDFTNTNAVAVSDYLEVFAEGKDGSNDSHLLQFDINKGLAAVLKLSGFTEISAQNAGDLEANEIDGQDISTDLETYGLTLPAFRYLSDVMKAAIELDEEAWENVFNIHIQAYKKKQESAWVEAEKLANVYITPSQFRQRPENKYEEPRTYTAWRGSYLDRLEWEERLNDRYEVVAAMLQANDQRLTETDKECLSLLRDALIDKTSSSGTLESKTAAMSDDLLLDLKNESHSQTTRVAVAIETLQSFVWRLRTGQLENSFADLNNIDDDFDAAWKWRSSYKTWKSAQFVNLFPENLLFPEIKPFQTEAYQSLVESLNNNPYIKPEDACTLANEYGEYLRDISQFDQVIGTFGEFYEGQQDPCGHYNPTGTTETVNDDGQVATEVERIPVIYFFGLKKSSGQVYYCIYFYEDENNNNEHKASVGKPSDKVLSDIVTDWKKVPGANQASELTACIRYPKQSRGTTDVPMQSINLYYTFEENSLNKPAYVTLKAKENSWEKKKNIRMPGDAADKNMRFLVGDSYSSATNLILSEIGGAEWYYHIKFNGVANDYETKEWVKVSTPVVDKKKVRRVTSAELTLKNTGETITFVNDIFTVPEAEALISLFSGAFDPDKSSYEKTTKNEDYYVKERVYIECVAAAGDAVILKSPEHKGRYFLGYKNFIVDAVNGGALARFANIIVDTNGATLENFFRWQDDDNVYVAIWQMSWGKKKIQVFDLSADYSKGLIVVNSKIEKDWSSHLELIKSVIFSPESNGDALFQNSTTNLDTVGFAICQNSNGAYLSKNVSAQYVSGNLTRLQLGNVHPREITPSDQTTKKYDASTDSVKTVNRDFAASIKPIGETSDSRASVLSRVYDGLLKGYRTSNVNYFEEAYYYVPMALADKLQRNGHFTEALDWYRLIYDYREPSATSGIFPRLNKESGKSVASTNIDLETGIDNPHTTARNRQYALSRYTLPAIARCLIEYADDEFTRDTSESIAKAHSLYEKAIELLSEVGFNNVMTDCGLAIENMDVAKTLDADFAPWLGQWTQLKRLMDQIKVKSKDNSDSDLDGVITYIEARLGSAAVAPDAIDTSDPSSIGDGLDDIQTKIEETIASQSEPTKYKTRQAFDIIFPRKKRGGLRSLFKRRNESRSKVKFREGQIFINYNFALPRNPVKDYLMMYAEINLFKMRNGMNIAGIVRSLDVYSTSPDSTTGMSFVGIGGQVVNTGATYGPVQTQFHYQVLLERAKQLAQIAGQMEGSMLSALEKYDAEQYSVKRAEQDLALAEESINLQDLRKDQAQLGVDLAKKQYERADISSQQMQDWLSVSFNDYHRELLGLYKSLKKIQNVIGGLNTATSVSSLIAQSISAVAEAGKAEKFLGVSAAGYYGAAAVTSLSSGLVQRGLNDTNYKIQNASLKLSYRQRRQEWTYQKNLAKKDKEIAQTQISIAKSQVQVVAQEKRMAELQRNFSEATLDFLNEKFTNADLYRWMGQVLEGVYAYFLRQATNMAQQAAQQLAFERQERVPVSLKEDYWKISSNGSNQFSQGESQDRKGLTGSARLLQDIYKIDQHAFDTDKRKLELSKTISLASLFPQEFQQFKETGVFRFQTQGELFDRDFPGHYLRLIKQVKTQVVALASPVDGIKATLVNNGISRTVVGGKGVPFTEINVVKQPETIALTGTNAANGMFELVSVYQQEKLLPFEGLGIETDWELRMPKPSNFFDYDSIADVIFTIDYTAKEDFLYAEEVKERIGTEVTTNRAFSFRNNLPDQWYDLLHPEETENPMSISFELTEKDFPANVQDLEIEDVVVYLTDSDNEDLQFKLKMNVGLENADGIGKGSVTTNRLNFVSKSAEPLEMAGIKDSPIGTWTLEFPTGKYRGTAFGEDKEIDNRQAAIDLFRNGNIDDVLFIITYKGQTANW